MKIYPGMVLAALLTLSGCSTVAPQYSPSIQNIQTLKNSGESQVAVGQFTGSDSKVNELTIRGGAFQSPVNNSYVEYLQKALEQELYDANRLNKNASVKITGILLGNAIDASGVNIGTAAIEAEFTVLNSADIRYKKTHSASIEWPSSFMGNIAIPRAIKEYPRVVQELLAKLYADPDFINAIK